MLDSRRACIEPTRLSFSDQGYQSMVRKQWVLEADPKIVLREESIYVDWDNWFWHTTPAAWWAVASIGKRKIGDREYPCVEIKHPWRFSVDGYVLITECVNPEIPDYIIEREQVFYKLEKDNKKTLSFVRLWKMLSLKPPKPKELQR